MRAIANLARARTPISAKMITAVVAMVTTVFTVTCDLPTSTGSGTAIERP